MASEKLNGVTNQYNTAKAAYEQAQQTEADLKKKYDQAVKDQAEKKAAYDTAAKEATDAKTAYDNANNTVSDLEQQISDLKSNMSVDTDAVKAGLLGFMDYIASSDNFSAQQKGNATQAAAMLDGSIEKTNWYDDYVDRDASRETNPLSLEQMRNALTYMDTQNNIRKANGQSELSVSLRMMAAAALNTSYSSNMWEHSGLGVYWDNAENLAGGGGAYTGGDTIETLGWPYTGLYTQEKVEFEKYVQKYGNDLEDHRYDAWYISQHYEDVSNDCGHYLNIIDSNARAFGVGTGSGKSARSMVTIFDFSDYDSQADFSVADFKALVNGYVDSVYHAGGTAAQKEQLKQLQDQLTAAKNDAASKKSAYEKAQADQAAAEKVSAVADNAAKTAESGYKQVQLDTATAQKAFDSAKTEKDAAEQKFNTAKVNLDKAKTSSSSAQTELDAANAKVTEAQTAADKAAKDRKSAQAVRDDAKTKSDAANRAYEDATASVEDLTAKRDTAKSELENKKKAYDKAYATNKDVLQKLDDANRVYHKQEQTLNKAENTVSNKEVALTEAQGNADSAKTVLAAANAAFQQYADAEQAAKDAQAALDAAQKGVADAQSQLDAANKAVEDAKGEIEEIKTGLGQTEALKADLEQIDEDASLAAGTTVFRSGYEVKSARTAFAALDAAYARYKKAVDAEAGLKQAAADADAKLSDANDAYAAALAKYQAAQKALAAAQAEYDKYHPKAQGTTSASAPAAQPQVTQAAAKTPAGNQQAASGSLAQTGDASTAAGEVFVIGGVTLVAAGVVLSDRRRLLHM